MFKSSKRLIAMLICLAMVLTMLPMSVLAADAPSTLYLVPNDNWKVDDARFAAYFFGNGETWVSMTDADGDGVYEVEVPAGYPSVIFCRMNPATTDNGWTNKWNQTADLTIPTDGTNCYTVKAGTWDNGGGSWSTVGGDCDHTYDDGKVTTAAGCTTTGVKTFTCTKCGAVYTEDIPANGHNYVDGVCSCGATCQVLYFNNTAGWADVYVHSWSDNGGTSWPGNTATLVEGSIYVINVDSTHANIIFHDNTGDTNKTADLVIPTDGKNQYNYDTGAWSVYGEAACTHANVTELAGKDATCTEAGLTAGSVCADCGVTVVPQKVINALGHSYDDEDVCETCGFAREMITVYFENNWAWVGVKCFTWGGSSVDSWPGVSAYATDYVSEGGATIYYAQIWNDVDGLIWNGTKTENGDIVYNEDGSEATDQTPDIKEFADGTVWYMAWDEANACNTVGTYDVSVFVPTCEHEYFYACDPYCSKCYELTNPDAAHNIIHVDAKAGTDCQNWDGNVEYWYCEYCGNCWLDEDLTKQTNRYGVVANGAHSYFTDCDTVCEICGEETRPEAGHNVVHVEAKDATCYEDGNIEYWYCDVCGAAWLNADCTLNTNLKAVVLAGGHNAEHVAESCYNVEYWTCSACESYWADEALTQVTNSKNVIKAEPSHDLEHVAESCYNTEYWYCSTCETYWADEALTQVTNSKNVIKAEASHAVEHVAESCYNTEYWYCSTCETYWADEALTQVTNSKNVIKAEATHNLEHVAESCWNVEYWTCSACETYWADEALTQVTNSKNVIKAEATHAVEHVAESCYNTEYWYCSACETYWADEALTQVTNSKNVIKAEATHALTHVEAKDATCTEDGNVEYWYCSACEMVCTDEAMTQVTNMKRVIVPAGHNYENGFCTECGEVEFEIKYQVKEGAIRLITYVDDLAGYNGVTFTVTASGGTLEETVTKAYSYIYDGENQKTAEDLFGVEGGYLVLLTVKDMPSEYEIEVVVTWNGVDGTTETSSRYIVVSTVSA